MSKQIQDVFVVAATRTAVGKARGAFRFTRPDDLLAAVLKEAVAKVPQVDTSKIGDVIVGCAMPEAEQGMNVARIGTLLAGLPESVPAITINRFCSSGLQAISMAADKVALGDADVVIAGGVESMSQVPMGGNGFSANPRYTSLESENLAIAYGMGITAEKVAQKWGITREQQDQFALRSHQNAIEAIDSGVFADEITPVMAQASLADLTTNTCKIIEKKVDVDEGPRRDTNIETLAKLRTVFHRKGTVTAGNTSQMSDGAAALILASEKAVNDYQLKPLAKFRGFSVAGVAPELMGIGPIKAIPKVCQKTGISQDQLDWIELNEAFAAQALAVVNEVELDINKVNPLGGAIALGHPLGATGAIRAATLIHALRRKSLKYGMVTMCIGTGMGAAGIFEAV